MKKYLILAALIPMLSFGQNPVPDKLITVVGFAEMEIEPDIIVLGMSVRENENSKKESSTALMEHNISNFLERIGIQKDHFLLDRYNAYNRVSLSSASKFKINKSYKITVNKVNLLDTIIIKCLEFGMDNIYIQRMDHSKMDSLQNVLLRNAVILARQKAKIISENLNIKVGNVSSIYESDQLIRNKNDQDYADISDSRLHEDILIGYGDAYKGRTGSTMEVQKMKLSKTILAKFDIQN